MTQLKIKSPGLILASAVEVVLPEHRVITTKEKYVEFLGFIDETQRQDIQTQVDIVIAENFKSPTPIIVGNFSYLQGNTRINFKTKLSKSVTDTTTMSLADFARHINNSKDKPFKEIAKLILSLAPSDRKAGGKLLNDLKKDLASTSAPVTKHQSLGTDTWLDVTLPGIEPPIGHLHPISQAINKITQIFESIGFQRVRYPEVDWDKYVFENLNMPSDHPARDEWETFFIDAPVHPKFGQMVLTTHTSNGQTREMERVKTPPIRMLNIAKCYRKQQDVTHTAMFHQFEGLVIDKHINIQHLKGVLDYFATSFYGPKAKSRIRPFHFQFTEPSFEVDFSCVHCEGKGCRFCKSGWHEVGGAGMVHPNVLTAGGIDPTKYSGFAFGWGVERVYTLQPGLQLDDIRPLYLNNLDFLANF